MKEDVFSIEVPKPLEMFTETIVHPDNVETYQHDNRARKLDKKRLKKLRSIRDELQSRLKQYKYDDRKQKFQLITERFNDLRIELENTEDPQERLVLKRRMKRLAGIGKRLQSSLEPARNYAGKLQRVLDRLEEHHMAIANESLYRRLRDEMGKEVYYFGRMIVDAWNRLGYCFDYSVKGKHKRHSVQFEKAIATEDEVQFKISVSSLTLLDASRNHLPNGVRVADLVHERTLDELSATVERQVTSPHGEGFDFRNGAWIVVHRLGLTDGLFNYISLEQILTRYEDDKSHLIPLPLGVKRGRKINWIHMREHPHLMFNGQTGSGKSNAIVGVCCTLVSKHSPDEIRLVLVDLKRGGDLRPFEKSPHSLFDVITDVTEFASIMQRLRALMYQRMDEISRIAVDIDSYNAIVPPERRMARILVVVDEYTAIKMDSISEKIINHEATILATQARASGIHLLIGNQQPYSDSVPKSVKGNITIVLTGRQRTHGGSLSTLGTSEATKLPKIPGRMLCDDGMDLFQVQLPHARHEDIERAVDASSNYPQPKPLILPGDDVVEATIKEAERPFTVDDLIRITILERDGRLSARPVWEANKDKLSQSQALEMVKEVSEMGEVEFNGETYEVVKERNAFRLLLREGDQVLNFSSDEVSTSYQLSHQLDNQLEISAD